MEVMRKLEEQMMAVMQGGIEEGMEVTSSDRSPEPASDRHDWTLWHDQMIMA